MNPLFLTASIFGAIFLVGGSIAKASTSGPDESSQGSDDSWTKFDAAFKRIGALYGVDWTWLKAIALNESSLGQDPRVMSGDTSSDGLSWGLMQVTLKTALLYDPDASSDKLAQLNPADYSIDLAAQILAENKREFPASNPRYLEWVIKRYNGSLNSVNAQRTGQDLDPDIAQRLDTYWARFQRNLTKVTT